MVVEFVLCLMFFLQIQIDTERIYNDIEETIYF